jgi:peptidoglycan hydrolase CwlO-like protein
MTPLVAAQMGTVKNESDQMVREFMQKNKRLQDERDDLNGQMKGLITKINALKEEVEDSRAAAEAANADKANVEKDWSTRLIKVSKPTT